MALYRNGFRVVPYGDSDNDWLQLDEAYAKRSILAPVANRNFFGAIQIDDVEGVYFEEHTSREGLVETPAFTRLKNIASSVLISVATRIAQERGRKTRTSKSDPNHGQFKDDGVKHSLIQLKEIVETKINDKDNNASKEHLDDKKEVIEAIEFAERNFEEYQKALADERSMLQFLATLGMTTAEFSHEAGMTFNAVRLDFKTIFDWMQRECKDDEFLSLAKKTQLMLARLDTLTSYLNSLAGARASRNVSALSLSKAVEEFSHGIKMQASNQGVELEVSVPDFDPLYSAPMHEAEIASILLNLYTNAVKAVKRKGKEKKIKVEASRSDGYVFFIFSDSGDGIAEENREKIYDAFFTTRSAPHGGAAEIEHLKGTGLGLWIVHQIVSNISGTIELTDSPDNYSTSFKVSFLEERPDE
ncbi:sensor histidine kinase [Halomonas sp. HNIBRBA4712]|uniref:sensor histidine kinase n=1 Tax=Halomonas sp. HNIBRBA4712 TaxID=3373087 RepID=UPI003746BD42